jgi:3-oxoacyl-[acyl-carrier protein] reductase
VRKFVEMTGDNNPLHLDRTYAESTSYKDIVVHGMLGASFISTVIGTKLPGAGALWISQNMEFLLPVRLGDVLTISVKVLKKHERDQLLELDTRIVNQNKQLILNGVGKVKVLMATQSKVTNFS